MPVLEEMEASGQWLLRWRGHIPLAILALFLAGLQHFTYPFGRRRTSQSSRRWGK